MARRSVALCSLVILHLISSLHATDGDGQCTAPPADNTDTNRVTELEAEVASLNAQIAQLNKDVELRDKKGMDLMKSYKTCSDKLDEVADKEADEGWTPESAKMLQDLTWLHSENKKTEDNLKKCEKAKKQYKKKYNDLKKKEPVEAETEAATAENCLTKEQLAPIFEDLLKDKPNTFQAIVPAFRAYAGCIIQHGLIEETSDGAPETDDSVTDLETCKQYLGAAQHNLDGCREKGTSDLLNDHDIKSLVDSLNSLKEKLDSRQKLLFEAMMTNSKIQESLAGCEIRAKNCGCPLEEDSEKEEPKQERPKMELYSAKNKGVKEPKSPQPSDVGSGGVCDAKLKAAEEEITRLNGIIDSDDAAAVKCKLQKQNLKVSRYFLRKWYFSEKAKSAELLQEITALENRLIASEATKESYAKDLATKEEKINTLTASNDNLERRMTHYEDTMVSQGDMNEVMKRTDECKESKEGVEQLLKKAEESLSKCAGDGEAREQLVEQYRLCGESLNFMRSEKDDIQAQLNHCEPKYKKYQHDYDEVHASFVKCTSLKTQLEMKEKGSQMVISQLEKEKKEEEDKAEFFEKESNDVIKEANSAKVNFLVTVILLVIVLAYNLSKYAANKLEPDPKGRSKAKVKSEADREATKLADKAARKASKKFR